MKPKQTSSLHGPRKIDKWGEGGGGKKQQKIIKLAYLSCKV